MSEPPTTPSSDRDAELAAVLAVPALDDTTRRDLVHTALDTVAADADDEVAGRRPGRLAAALGVAAALVIGAVVGTVIVTRPDDPATETAARAPATTSDEDAAKAAAPDPGATDSQADDAAATESGAPPADLGDLGPVDGVAGVRAAVNARLEAGTSATPASVPCTSALPGGSGAYGLVLITAAGTANLDGSGIVVLVGPTPAGANVAILLDPARGCEYLRRVRL